MFHIEVTIFSRMDSLDILIKKTTKGFIIGEKTLILHTRNIVI